MVRHALSLIWALMELLCFCNFDVSQVQERKSMAVQVWLVVYGVWSLKAMGKPKKSPEKAFRASAAADCPLDLRRLFLLPCFHRQLATTLQGEIPKNMETKFMSAILRKYCK
jgi:hypothetical protein